METAMQLFSITEAAEKLDVTRDKIWALIQKKLWAPTKSAGGTYLLDEKDVEDVRKLIASRSRGAKKSIGKLKHLRNDSAPEGAKS